MRVSKTSLLAAGLAASSSCLASPVKSYERRTTANGTQAVGADSLFSVSMEWLDSFYDPSAGYLYVTDAADAMRHETRTSSWYAAGLLARNNGTDVEEAEKVLRNVALSQFSSDPADQWYGTYQKEPEEPTVGTAAYPAEIYNSWDPNWRGFIGCTFVLVLEEYSDLISEDLVELLRSSLITNAIGDTYRVGGVDGDNLYPYYTNPWLMRTLVSGYVGYKLNDSNMTTSAETWAQEFLDLFDRASTTSEFNVPTYYGIDMWALTMWSKYMPSTSVLGSRAPDVLAKIWGSVTEFYHPDLKNLAGPWDRTYGYDMTKYVSLLAVQIWALVGKEASPLFANTVALSHGNDFCAAPLFAILAPYMASLLPANITSALTTFTGEHTVSTSAYSPPFDTYPRNITAWLAPNISIGAQSVAEPEIGGPSLSATSYSPAVVQWQTGNSGIGWIHYYPTDSYIDATASASTLNISYPYGNSSSIFTFQISEFIAKRDVGSWDDLQGLSVSVSASSAVDMNYTVTFAGAYGGADETIDNFEFWNFTYAMQEDVDVVEPWIAFEFDLE